MPRPPVAKAEPHQYSIHGETRVDNYHWLRQRGNPEVIEYLETENAYTEAVMAHTKPLQETLYQEMLGRIKETDVDVPVRMDDFYYYSRTEEGKQYRIHCRKKGSLEAAEQIILDQNVLAKGTEYFRLGVFEISPDHRLLAYSSDTDGSETYTLRVKNLETGELLGDEIPNTYYSVEWANDNRTLFYNVLDQAKRPYKLFRHVLGSDPAQDDLVLHEADDAFFLGLSKTRSKKYLLAGLKSNTTTEIHYLDADQPDGAFAVMVPRTQDMEYYAAHHGEQFLIRTNLEAKNFRVMTAPVSDPALGNWREMIPHRDDVLLEALSAFEDHLVVYERENGLERIRVSSADNWATDNWATDNSAADNSDVHHIEFDEPVYSLGGSSNPEFKTQQLRFVYNSLTTPLSVFDYDMSTRTRELKKQYEVLGGYDPSEYKSERVFAVAPDGVKVAISLVYKKGLVKDGGNPLFLYGYGSYGYSIDPNFSSSRLSLLDRGFVFAIAHIRGGEEMGRQWYDDGKLLHKRNTFSDFSASAEHLIAEKYTDPRKLVTQGGSAGGLLMGAVLNMRPDLFHAAIAAVPFVDVVNTMLDASIPLTVTEYEEWGNPNEPEFYNYIKSYSPYDNVEAKAYPHVLVTAGLNDPRVQYWEPAKWTAKLRAHKTDTNRLLLKTEMGAGHGGPSGRYEKLREKAFEYAFLFDVLGIGQ